MNFRQNLHQPHLTGLFRFTPDIQSLKNIISFIKKQKKALRKILNALSECF